MNLKFILNEYILIWNLLFKKSLSKSLNERKQKIWVNYKKQYGQLQKERENILKDPQNYIPTDDTIYNIIRDEEEYKEIAKYTSKYKFTLNRIFDIEKVRILEDCRNITKIDIEDYLVLIVDPRLKIVDYVEGLSKVICYGKTLPDLNSLFDIISNIYRKEILELIGKELKNKEIIDTILDLFITELRIRVTGNGNYTIDNNNLLSVKIYSAFLMYLGVKIDEIESLLKREGIELSKEILYDLDDNRYLYKKNLYVFIKYCDEHFIENSYIEENNEPISIRIEEII